MGVVFTIIEWIVLVLSVAYIGINVYTIVTGKVFFSSEKYARVPYAKRRTFAIGNIVFTVGILLEALGYLNFIRKGLQTIGWIIVLVGIIIQRINANGVYRK